MKLRTLMRRYARVNDKVTILLLRRIQSLDVEQGVTVRGWPEIDSHPQGKISIGQDVVLCSRTSDTALGVTRPVVLRTLLPGAQIHVGRNAGLSGTVVCAAISVSIGDNSLIGSEVIIADTDFHPIHHPNERRRAAIPLPLESHRVVIGENVFIGARSIILKGTIIGDGSVVGAGSVVKGKFPANSIIAGNPARSIGVVEASE
ncbi:acyltransferase [Pseudarthrobacter sp. fls2-241-R2A-127]|uniref:acyltransferase n=1 Tax=Pseudarthrobacter sp. fls2-241-R2A-127 TaxID=3040303 RepID=UPI002556F37F|nr:acyltransferase [Pseudarthrobacter sp. fls2-241-R2A-127]